NAVLRVVQGLHFGQLVPERRDFMLHPLDLDLSQLSAECLDFIPQTRDPDTILDRSSFGVVAMGFHGTQSKYALPSKRPTVPNNGTAITDCRSAVPVAG